MRVGFKGHRVHTAQQPAKTGFAGKIGAQHQRVGKEPDQVFSFWPHPVCNRRTNGNVFLPRVARKQDVESGQQSHK